jgi:hypothetical protein
MQSNYERRPGMSARGLFRLILNLLTFLVILGTLAITVGYVLLFFNPYMSVNPYPPPTVPATLGSPTPTNTPAISLGEEWTATPQPTEVPTDTPTPEPTETPVPTATETSPGHPFALQVGSPTLIQNFVNGQGCEWMGVFGQIFNIDNQPILELSVRLGGELEGLDPIDMTALSGSAPDLGPGAYLFNIADQPIASEGTLWIQLDDGGGNPLSEKIYLTTSDSCTENLVMVNWRQVR